MNKIFFTVFFTSLLFAQENISGNPTLNNIIQTAMLNYKNSNYLTAIEELLKLKDVVNTPEIDYYLGRCYYEIGQYEQALAAYERVLINEPNNQRVILEVGETYFMLRMYKEAKEQFELVLSDFSIPETVRNNIMLKIKEIESNTKKSFFNLTMLIGYGFEDNINDTTNISSYNIYIPTYDINSNITTDEKTDSTFLEKALLLSHLYKQQDNLAYRTYTTIYSQKYTEDSSKDLTVISIGTTPIYTKDKTNYMLDIGYDYIWYDDSKYLQNYYLTPKLSYLIDQNMMYDIYFKLLKKDFYKSNDDKDSHTYEVSNKLTFKHNKYGIFGFELLGGMEERRLDIRTDVSKEYLTFKVHNSYKIYQNLTINNIISYTDTKYKFDDVNFLTKRKDKAYNLNTNLGYNLSDNTIISLSYNYTNQNSNHEPFNYDKQVVKTSLYYNF